MIAMLSRVFAAGCMAWATAMCLNGSNSGWHQPLAFLLFLALLLLSILVHELGHAVAALAVRWKIIVISAGWIAYHAFHRQLLITRRVTLEDAGGWVFAVPEHRSLSTAKRKAAFVAGGPLASLLQAVICLCVAALLEPQIGAGSYRYDLNIAAFGAIGLAHFFMTAVPTRSKKAGRQSDGAKLLELWRTRKLSDTFPLALLAMLLRCNVRLRELPDWLVEALREQAKGNQELTNALASMEIGRMLDGEKVDPVAARHRIDQYWREHEPSDWLMACDAYVAAVYERNAARARDMVSQIGQPSTSVQMEYAAKAALKMLEGDRAATAELLKRMDKTVAEASPYRNPTFRDIRAQIENLTA